MKSIFIDIDGTLIRQDKSFRNGLDSQEVLPDVLEKLKEWYKKGYNLIVTTARRESTREETVKQLVGLGIHFDQLIMGVGGTRVLINNRSAESKENRAIAINPELNEGLGRIFL